MMTSLRQLEIAVMLYDKGPLTSRELNATGALLAHLERRGIIEPVPNDDYMPTAWRLTAKGRTETRNERKAQANALKLKK